MPSELVDSYLAYQVLFDIWGSLTNIWNCYCPSKFGKNWHQSMDFNLSWNNAAIFSLVSTSPLALKFSWSQVKKQARHFSSLLTFLFFQGSKDKKTGRNNFKSPLFWTASHLPGPPQWKHNKIYQKSKCLVPGFHGLEVRVFVVVSDRNLSQFFFQIFLWNKCSPFCHYLWEIVCK